MRLKEKRDAKVMRTGFSALSGGILRVGCSEGQKKDRLRPSDLRRGCTQEDWSGRRPRGQTDAARMLGRRIVGPVQRLEAF
jgi:hypothetical protein